MVKFTRKVFLTAGFLALLSQNVYSAPAETVKAPAPSDVMAKVNGKNITRENLEIAINNLMPLMSYHSSVSDERMKEIKKKAIDQLIDNEVIYKYAKDQKQDSVKSKEIDAEVDSLKKSLPKGQSLKDVLKRSSMTMEDLKEDIKRSIVVKNTVAKKVEEMKKTSVENVTDAYLLDYYKKNMNKFKEPEQIHLRSILVKADPSGGQKVWNESLKKANELVKQIKGGEDFAAVAKKNSEDPFAKDGGDMGWAHRGSLFQEIDEVAAKLNVGEVSEPINTIYGYHIIKLEAKKPSVQRKFEEINKEKLKKELEQKEYKKLWEEWLGGLKAASRIEYIEKLD